MSENVYNKVHSVPDRIVSLSQPYIRPIVRGKAKAPTEFGAKLDISIDEQGMARIEKISFDAYNESEVLQQAVERYKLRTGHYPERVLVDQIYRNRKNISFCKERGIRISSSALGRSGKNYKANRKTEYQDNADRMKLKDVSAWQNAVMSSGRSCVNFLLPLRVLFRLQFWP